MNDLDRTEALEGLASHAYDDVAISEVIRPAAVVPEEHARTILYALAARDVRNHGPWDAQPDRWQRYDRPWTSPDGPGAAQLLGTIQIIHGRPTRYDVTIFRVTLTPHGLSTRWTVNALCDDALSHAGLTLATCPRDTLTPPPPPFRMP